MVDMSGGFHIPTPEESDAHRSAKKPKLLKRLFGSSSLNVPPEVGQQKKIEPPPPSRTAASAPLVPPPASVDPLQETASTASTPPSAASPPRGVRISPRVVAARGNAHAMTTPAEPLSEAAELERSVERERAGAAPPPMPSNDHASAAEVDPVEESVVRPGPREDGVIDTWDLPRVVELVRELQNEVRELRSKLEAQADPLPASLPEIVVEEEPPPSAVSQESLLQTPTDLDMLLAVPRPYPPDDFAPSVRERGELFYMTNRLNPLKVSVRVLANMRMSAGAWPLLTDFQVKAAWAARHLGEKLKQDDNQKRAARSKRRAMAYPTGPKVEQSLQRFIVSFTLDTYAEHGGPLQLLNLARIEDDRAVLTPFGWGLASHRGPLIDGEEGHLLTEAEMGILRHQLQEAPGEGASVAQFLRLVSEAKGVQTMLDEYLDDTLPERVADVASWRTGMLGRLRDVALVEVDGEGKNARIRLTDAARTFLRAWPEGS